MMLWTRVRTPILTLDNDKVDLYQITIARHGNKREGTIQQNNVNLVEICWGDVLVFRFSFDIQLDACNSYFRWAPVSSEMVFIFHENEAFLSYRAKC